MYKYGVYVRMRIYAVYTVLPQTVCDRMDRIYVSTVYTYTVYIQTVYTYAVYTRRIYRIYTGRIYERRIYRMYTDRIYRIYTDRIYIRRIYTPYVPYICETSPKKAIKSKIVKLILARGIVKGQCTGLWEYLNAWGRPSVGNKPVHISN